MPHIAVLIDNIATRPNLRSQHGLSIWIDAGDTKILFDTGINGLFLENAQTLEVPVGDVTHLVLSHGHYDHCGGVPFLLKTGVTPQVIIGPNAWVPRQSSHPIGIPWEKELLSDLSVVINEDTCEIGPQISVVNIGGISKGIARTPRLQRFVDGRWEPDIFPDEQMLMIRTTEGYVVVTGCTHCGTDVLIQYAKKIAGNIPIYALIGGLHLFESTPESINSMTKNLFDIKHLWVNHCTGLNALEMMKKVIGNKVEWAETGFHIEFPPLFE